MMNKLYKSGFWTVSILALTITVFVFIIGVENNHLIKENAKFKHEIEYLKGSNELLQEDNQDMQDRLWNLYNNEMKGSN